MTCIVGIAHQGQVLLGGDSAATSYEEHEIHSVGNSKVFHRGPYVLGYTTSFRLGNILEYQTELPDPPKKELEKFLSTEVTMALRQSFEAAGWQDGLSPMGSIILGTRGRLFVFGAEMQLAWLHKPYVSIGAGRQVAYGTLHALEDQELPPKTMAERALQAAQEFVPGVRRPFTFVET